MTTSAQDVGPQDLAAAAAAVLAERGPLAPARLLAALLAAGHDLGPHPLDAIGDLIDDDDGVLLGELADGRVVAPGPALTGRVLTHRVGAAEASGRVLALGPDLDAAARLLVVGDELGEDLRWSDGTPVRALLVGLDDDELDERGTTEDVLVLPAGAPEVAAGGLVALRTVADGWQLDVLDEDPAGSDLGGRLAAVLPAPAVLVDVLAGLCADDPALLTTPGPPLAEVLAAAGLVVDGEWVAPAGTDLPAWHREQHVARVVAEHGVSPAAADAVRVLVELHDEVVTGPVPRSGRPVATADDPGAAADDPGAADERRVGIVAALAHLAEPGVAEALLDEALDGGTETEDLEALAALARSCEQLAPRGALAPLRWLRAHADELLGATLEAEQALDEALDADPGWPPALADLARFAGDRGDVERALSLLRRAEVPGDDELVVLLEGVRSRPRPDLGRNDRCWCGSGRKYKQCHLGSEELPLADRAAWLHGKARIALGAGRWAEELAGLDEVHADVLDAAGLAWDDEGDGFVPDVVLAEGGGLAAFLGTRGVLLPADERELVARWLGVRRSVHEVVGLPGGDSVELVDLRDGARRTVAGARRGGLRVGGTVTARVLPVGDGWCAPGGVDRVAAGWREPLLAELDAEPAPAAVVRALTLATRTGRPA